ncbi:nuclear transport factor 2 family protein [Yeosuana sp.]|uniref:nuclear transport factor 2 family protein n=1 Tax=Yeosuana sp. TaxID=2529388 RepID=UPI004054E03A|tara:strand:- start:2239 stop:3168 length:930 start_codon:yes stop_codon:yes gene_type:complete
MKKHAIIVVMLFASIMYSQKKKNGAIYNEHPAITVVEAMQQATVKGDTALVSSYLTKDFRAISGFNADPDAKGRDKQNFLNGVLWMNNNIAYMSLSRSPGAYPDALEYDKSGSWVQTWDQFRGVNNETGVKIDMPVHRLFVLNNDNKISRMITYEDNSVWDNLRDSYGTRTNGTLYNHHENINKVLRMVAALEHSDADKGFSYFTEDAIFTNLDMADGESNTVAEEKEGFLGMLKDWAIEAIDVNGYPDYLEYELGNAKVVQSWWTARMTRKSDGKKVKLPLMFIHDFNDEGMITREAGYYTLQALSAK